jgi:outer membrane protein TolC
MVSLKIAFAIALITACCPTPAFAQPVDAQTPTVGIDEAVTIALKQHPALAQIRFLQAAAAARVAQDRATVGPQATFGLIGQLGNTGGSYTLKAPDVLGAGSGNISLGSRLSVIGPLDSGAALNVGQALWNPLLSARTHLDTAQQRAQDANYTLQARHLVGIAHGIKHNRDLTLAQTQALERAGLAAGLDVQQADLRVQSARADEILATNLADAAYTALITQLGYDPALTPSLTLVDVRPDLSAKAVTNDTAPPSTDTPLLALARAQQAIAKTNIEVAEAATAPRVSAYLNAGLSPSLGADAFAQPLYGGGLELSAPIYTSGLRDAQVDEARAQASAANEGLRALTDAYRQNVLDARLSFSRDQERFAVLDTQVKLARRSLELARQRYRFRLASFLDVVTAETAEADVENHWNDAGYALGEDQANVSYLTGSDLARYTPSLK